MKHHHRFCVVGLGLALVVPVEASTTFDDQTFDLADYTITKSLQIGVATVSQTLTDGHPGAATLAEYSIPSTGPSDMNELGSVFYLNNGFTYDTASSGAISTIVLSIDKNVDIVTPPDATITNGQSFLIEEGGQYFVGAVALGSAQNVYHTATLTATADDFYLITDMSSGTIDATVHPSFSSGVLDFGFRNGFVFGPQTAADVKILEDNFSVTVTSVAAPVPEPGTVAMLLMGLGALAGFVRRTVRPRVMQ